MSLRVIKKGSVAGVIASNLATVTIAPQDGLTELTNVNFFSDAVGTYKIYRPRHQTTANAAVAASATLVIDTDTEGKVGGSVIGATDYILVADTSGTGWQLVDVSSVAAVSSSTVSLTLGSSITCSADDGIYIVRVADILSRATTDDERVIDAKDQAVSFDRMPMVLQIAATGTNELTATFEVFRL